MELEPQKRHHYTKERTKETHNKFQRQPFNDHEKSNLRREKY